MDDFDKTIAPRYQHISSDTDDVTIPGKREHKSNGRFAVGHLIMNRYKVLEELGQGGMGVVYKCFDETAGIEVALKALPPELSHNTIEMEDIKDNFQLIHNLHHPNIACTNNIERDNSNGNYYLIMECCQGEDLRRWLRRKRKNGGLKLEDVLPIIQQVAEALDYAHEMKIIHRDIKPGNIMIDQFGKIKVLDFGLAAQIHTSMTRVSMAYHGTSGTGPYMAPEQWRGRAQGAPADQYALAVMTYEMLAGHLPFEGSDAAVLRESVLNDTPEDIADTPKTVQNAIKRAMQKEPAERFARCSDFAAAMAGKKSKTKKIKKNNGFPKWVAILIIALLLCVGVSGYYFFDKYQKAQNLIEEEKRLADEKAEQERSAKIAAQKAELERQNKLALEKQRQKEAKAEQERLAKIAEQEEEKIRQETIEKERIDSENTALKVELNQKIAEIKYKNYDPAQTFGHKTEEMHFAFLTANNAKLHTTANKKYKEAKQLADWILINGELRESAKTLRSQAQNNRSAAEKYEPAIYANALFTKAEVLYQTAEKFYNNINFANAKNNFENAAKLFEQAKNTAFDNKLLFLIAEAKKAEHSTKWNELKVWAAKIRPLNSSLANQLANKADNELKYIAVNKNLTFARNAKTAKNWQNVYDYATQALKIDNSNTEAQKLKKEAAAIIHLQKARQELNAGNWESASQRATEVLKIIPDNIEARNLLKQAEENMIKDDATLKRYLLHLCGTVKNPDFSQKSAISRLKKFDFNDFSPAKYSSFDAYSLLSDVIDIGAALPAVQYLIERKNQTLNPDGKYVYSTPLCYAAKHGNLPVLKYLISNGAKLNPVYSVKYGLSPLSYAKDIETVKILLNAGADARWKNNKGQTLADTADFDKLLLLIAHGAELTKPQDIYRKAAKAGNLEYLKKHASEAAQIPDLMINAAYSGKLDVIKYLETLKLSFTATDKNNNTVLHAACSKNGSVELFSYLQRKSGLPIDIRDKAAHTPLLRALNEKNHKMTAFLISNGADITARDNDGNPILYHALWHNCDPDVVRKLIEKGADVNERYKKYNWTPLYIAVYNEYIDLVNVLIENGANVNAKVNNWTLAFWAYNRGNLPILRLLVKNGANLNIKNNRNSGWETALHAAVYDKNIAMIKVLLELGADPAITDELGRSPMSLAKTAEIQALLRNYRP